MKEKYCYWASHGMVFSNDRTFRPCCRFNKSEENVFPQQGTSIQEAFNSEAFVNIRQILASGQFPDGCSVCIEEEEQGLRSLRRMKGEHRGEPGQLESLEIFLGSLCNMKCRMCDHESSSLWATELDKETELEVDISNIFDNSSFASLKRLRLLGGETLLNRNFLRVCDRVSKEVDLKNVEFSFATNGSVEPNSKVKNILSKFGTVLVDISLDGIGEVGEYIRHGVSWSKVEQGVKSWCLLRDSDDVNLILNVHTTIQAANYLDIPNIISFCIEHGLTWSNRTLDYPLALNVRSLSKTTRRIIAEKHLDHPHADLVKNYLAQRQRNDIWPYLTEKIPEFEEFHGHDFVAELETYDQKWNVCWRDALPDLEMILHQSHKTSLKAVQSEAAKSWD